MIYKASRWSKGNRFFRTEILLEKYGVKVNYPSLFGGKSHYFDFSQITSVLVESPMVGYSTITFYSAGTQITAHGFTRKIVKEIQEAVERSKSAKN
jgi:lysozyme family protein